MASTGPRQVGAVFGPLPKLHLACWLGGLTASTLTLASFLVLLAGLLALWPFLALAAAEARAPSLSLSLLSLLESLSDSLLESLESLLDELVAFSEAAAAAFLLAASCFFCLLSGCTLPFFLALGETPSPSEPSVPPAWGGRAPMTLMK